MRQFLPALIALALAGCASTPDEAVRSVEIEEIKPRYIPEENFVRISEYWTGAENTGKRVILRSDPKIRDGYYFTLVLDQKVRDLPRGTVITGEFYTPVSKDLQIHDFALPNKLPKTREVFVGLTGDDWPEADAVPGAWRFTIKDASGEVLGRKQSYLWSM
ncbi:MAG TPA: hypothetical protein VJ952_10870 [Opitutales bacterium]|nr:hypothetical protein [Opitutales bacterium]